MATIISLPSPLSRRSLSMLKGVAIGSIALVLAACGGDSSSGGSAATESDLMVSTYDDLPVCSNARDGAMAYVKDKKVTYVCVDGDWTLEESSSSPEDDQAGAVKDKSISGVSQKGPFLKGTTVTAYELDGSKSLLQTGRTFSGSITQDDGRFNLSNVTLKSSYVRLSANGFYRNEVTGENSKASITLNAVTDLSSRNTVNVNLLTHLEFDRVSHLMAESDGTLKIKDAKKQAEKEIFEAFHIDATGFGYSEDLDVFGNTDADAALLAISILLQGDRTESELTELLAELSDDLSDGKWDAAVKRVEIAEWAFEMDFQGKFDGYRSNVRGWGLSTTVPNFEKYVRQFWNVEKSGLEKCSESDEGEWLEQTYRKASLMLKCENGVWNAHALKDLRDGQDYRVMKIGEQIWMAENLAYNDSTYSGQGKINCWTSADSCKWSGRYYTWAAAMDSAGIYSSNGLGCGNGKTCSPTYPVRGICPEGWHLPDTTEWRQVYTVIGESPLAMQAMGYEEWFGATDAYGFSALPAGSGGEAISGIYVFNHVGEFAKFWSAAEYDSNYAFFWGLKADRAYHAGLTKDDGFAIRCVQD